MVKGAVSTPDQLPTEETKEEKEDVLSILDEPATRKVTKDDWVDGILEDPFVLARYRIKAREGRLEEGLLKQLQHYKWGKPPDKIEVTGKDGGPVSVVRVVLVKPEPKE